MIIPYNKKEYVNLLDFVQNYVNDDFYITKNNQRLIIKDYKTLNLFLKESFNIYICKEKDIQGVIALWKAKVKEIIRSYVKLNATDKKVADKLLDILVSNYNNDLYVKIRKDSEFLEIFKRRGFKFFGDRGSQLLLYRQKIKEETN